MNLLYDNVIYALQKVGGISLVWSELLKRLIKDENINLKCLEYNNENLFRNEFNIPQSIILENKDRLPLSIIRYLNPKQKDFEGVFHSSYYRFMNSKKVCNITTVHDFTYEYYRNGLAKKIHTYQKKAAINNSEKIICISEHTKLDLLKFNSNIPESKVEVVYNGVDEQFIINEDIKVLKTLVPFESKGYLLYVGDRVADYKNFKMAVEASHEVKMPLVIVGGGQITKTEKAFLEIKLKNKYKSLIGVSNQILNILYSNAFCFLYPSLYEGFGLPIVEAQNSGCPVITTNVSSIPEVVGKGGILLTNINSGKISEAIKSLKNDSEKRELLVIKGLENGKRFSWDLCYSQTKEIYKKTI